MRKSITFLCIAISTTSIIKSIKCESLPGGSDIEINNSTKIKTDDNNVVNSLRTNIIEDNNNINTKQIKTEHQNKWIDIFKNAKSAALRGGLFAASAGLIQVIALMWLRTTMNYQYRYGVTLKTALKNLYNQGGIIRFYRGITYAIVLGPLSKFGATAANEGSKVLIESYKWNTSITQLTSTILGTVFTVIWRLFLMPLETCKTVLQVDGTFGFQQLIQRVMKGNISSFYQGSVACIMVTATSHYPWFYVYNLLDNKMKKVDNLFHTIYRSAFIGFMASAVSDSVSNFLRILKTIKQSGPTLDTGKSLSYLNIINMIYKEGGIKALFGRGLGTRIIANGIQSILFTVCWKVMSLYYKVKE